MSELPDKIGDLIRLAVKDLTLCEDDPQYKINMEYWHKPGWVTDLCYVCLAGSVIAQTLEMSPNLYYSPGCQIRGKRIGDVVEAKIRLLDSLREARFVLAEMPDNYSKIVGLNDLIDSGKLFDAIPYEDDPVQFKEDMLHLADLMDQYNVHYVSA